MYFWIKILIFLCLSLGLASHTLAYIGSTNYRITSSVLAGGGCAMSSSHFETTSTIGQSTPIEKEGYLRCSDFYLFSGFWSTLYEMVPGNDGFLPAIYLLLLHKDK